MFSHYFTPLNIKNELMHLKENLRPKFANNHKKLEIFKFLIPTLPL